MFGGAASIDVDTIVVGAAKEDEEGTDAGASYVFEGACDCSSDLNEDDEVSFEDIVEVLENWRNPYDFDDLSDVVTDWGPCPCSGGAYPDTLQAIVECMGLDWPDDWLSFEDCMENGSSGEQENCICWMLHYYDVDCLSTCLCAPDCPGLDPWGNH